jgi:hypothetical protein
MCNYRAESKHGLFSTDHMWKFYEEHLNSSNNKFCELLTGQPIYGLSTDLEEATDYGNPHFARILFDLLIEKVMSLPCSDIYAKSGGIYPSQRIRPVGLLLLARDLFCGPR